MPRLSSYLSNPYDQLDALTRGLPNASLRTALAARRAVADDAAQGPSTTRHRSSEHRHRIRNFSLT
jgi:hypothetical protein